MKRTTTALTALALAAGSLTLAAPATAAPAATPAAVVQVQEGAAVQVQESRFPTPTKGQRIRAWVCNLAPAICR